MTLSPAVRSWVIWLTTLALTTIVLQYADVDVQQEQASLAMLLVVLGGSVAGGRPLGFTLAIVSSGLIDLYFQNPRGALAIPQPLDVVVLMAFLATAFVTTDLLTRARQEAAAARARQSEVEVLSRMGAETLRYASAEEALEAVATLVRRAIGADTCAIVPWSPPPMSSGTFTLSLSGMDATPEPDAEGAISVAVATGFPALIEHSEVATHTHKDLGEPGNITVRARLLALPLSAEGRTIGVLVVRGRNALELNVPQRRLLAALSYYAALGLERMQLMSAAASSKALHEAQRAKEEVFAAVSHDLRTPISTIKLLAQNTADRGDRSALVIVEQADRLSRLVGDLLEMSRFRTGSTRLVPELNTVEDLVGAALRQIEGIRAGHTIDVQIDFDAPALVGRFDFVHTLRIITNLLDNALRYSPAGAAVQIAAERTQGFITIAVRDRGPGIAVAERERIFEPFYRPADASADGGHTGLGLSIARSLAERQGGNVSYVSRPGGGSQFIIQLPAADIDDLSVSEPA